MRAIRECYTVAIFRSRTVEDAGPYGLYHIIAFDRAIRECYTVAIFARVLKSKLSDTSSLDYPPLRFA